MGGLCAKFITGDVSSSGVVGAETVRFRFGGDAVSDRWNAGRFRSAVRWTAATAATLETEAEAAGGALSEFIAAALCIAANFRFLDRKL